MIFDPLLNLNLGFAALHRYALTTLDTQIKLRLIMNR